jgi:hypothetical protein
VRNPLQNEETAFRFLLGVIVYFAVIVVASWIWTWLGVAAFVVASVVAARVLRGRGGAADGEAPGEVAAVADTRRILVLANETILGPRLREAIVGLASGGAEDVLLVCPAEPARPAEPEQAAAEAGERLALALSILREAGVRARGEVYHGGPVAALESALSAYAPDEIVVSTYEAGHSRWLEAGVVDAIRARYAGPVTHVTEPPPA